MSLLPGARRAPRAGTAPPTQTPGQRAARKCLGTVVLLAGSVLGIAFGAYTTYDWVWGSEAHWRAAQEAVKRHDFARADRHLTQYLKAKPGRAEAHLLAAQVARRAVQPHFGGEDEDLQVSWSGQAAFAADSYKKAERHLNEYQRLGGVPELVQLERLLANAQNGDLRGIEGQLWGWVENGHPEAVLILEALAKGYLVTYRLVAAEKCLDRLLELEESPQALCLRGWLAFRTLKYERACELFRKALQLDPDYEGAEYQLAAILRIASKPQEALGHYQNLRHQRPEDREVALGLAETHLALGLAEEARQVIDPWLAEEPNNPYALLLRAKVEWKAQHAAEAETLVRKVLRKRPWDRQANVLLGECLDRRGDKSERREVMTRLDRIQREIDRLDEVTRGIVYTPDKPALRWEAGMLVICGGQPKAGLRWLRSVLAIDPQHQPTLRALGEFERLGGKAGGAFYRQAHLALVDYYQQFSEPQFKALAAYHAEAARLIEQDGPAVARPK
jgi:tetratricopeptide (TPR) repeat protein